MILQIFCSVLKVSRGTLKCTLTTYYKIEQAMSYSYFSNIQIWLCLGWLTHISDEIRNYFSNALIYLGLWLVTWKSWNSTGTSSVSKENMTSRFVLLPSRCQRPPTHRHRKLSTEFKTLGGWSDKLMRAGNFSKVMR